MAADDAGSFLARARGLETDAHERMAEAQQLVRRAATLGSLQALNELVRLCAAERNINEAYWLLMNAVHLDPDLAQEQLVSVAPDIAGPAWARDADGNYDWPGAGVFTVIAADSARAAATLDRIAEKLMLVDEHGTV
jgi:hypothetical protein